MAFNAGGFERYLTIIGSILGIFSFIIVIYRLIREKPILNFRIGRHEHRYFEGGDVFSIYIEMFIDNVGERGTTINKIELINSIPRNYYELLKKSSSVFEINIPPHSTRSIKYDKHIKNYSSMVQEIDELKGELKISWTHNNKVIPFTSIRHI